jgi:GT2 family glycosyltransferase
VKQQSPGVYDNPFYYNNVYGHVLALLREHKVDGAERGIHLDLGCGFGRIAEPLTADLGVTYVGADADGDGLESLRTRGFEAHTIHLGEEEPTYEALLQIVGSRHVVAISMLDVLEHLVDGDAVLRAIGRLAIKTSALVVVSVPNITHSDIGLKLAFGRWDYTETGLLDHTHVRLFSADVLGRMLSAAGLYTVASNDVRVIESDQHFPSDHPALARSTQLHAYLIGLRQSADGNADVNQFVRLCTAGPPALARSYLRPQDDAPVPFLSIIVRTQGRRPHTLVEALTALAGQTDTDFEVIVIGHRLQSDAQKVVERIIDDSPKWLRLKCRLLLVDAGNRTRPLNEGFAAARGHYIAILDDDDLPFGHWVEEFRSLAEQLPGRMLRAVAVRQDVCNVTIDGRLGLRAIGTLEKIYPSEFDYLAHLRVNRSPPVSVAFPRGVFQDLGVIFDESLTTTEDWDYILRVAALVGVASSTQITAIYRWWREAESSRSVHSQAEWDRNHTRILQKTDEVPIVFPTGTASRIRFLLDQYDGGTPDDTGTALAPDRLRRLQEVVAILTSTSWRIAGPLRFFSRLLGKPAPDYSYIWHCDAVRLQQTATALRQSNSWRITAPLRLLRGG